MKQQIILGLGAGQCGMRLLAQILNKQPHTKVTHEQPPLLPWVPDKLPPRTGVKRKVKKAATAAETSGTSEKPMERTDAARVFGIRMLIAGAIATVAPLFGLQMNNLGALTSVLGVILLVVGGISFGVSKSRTSANVATSGVKIIMWGIIGFGVLIFVVAAIALVVMVSKHGFR